jgi:hypothetical protein
MLVDVFCLKYPRVLDIRIPQIPTCVHEISVLAARPNASTGTVGHPDELRLAVVEWEGPQYIIPIQTDFLPIAGRVL